MENGKISNIYKYKLKRERKKMKKILLLIMFLCMVSCGKYIDQFKSNTQEDKTFINEVLANRYKNIYKDNEEDLISNIILYQMYLKEKGENIEYLSADQIIDKIQIRVNRTDIPALSNLPFEVTPDLKGFIEVIGKNINENGVPEYYRFSVVMYYPYDKELSIDVEFLAEFLEKNFSEEEVATYRKLMQITPGKHIKL
jgi:hypothetical protein